VLDRKSGSTLRKIGYKHLWQNCFVRRRAWKPCADLWVTAAVADHAVHDVEVMRRVFRRPYGPLLQKVTATIGVE
jgi:hypothetical protein